MSHQKKGITLSYPLLFYSTVSQSIILTPDSHQKKGITLSYPLLFYLTANQ